MTAISGAGLGENSATIDRQKAGKSELRGAIDIEMDARIEEEDAAGSVKAAA